MGVLEALSLGKENKEKRMEEAKPLPLSTLGPNQSSGCGGQNTEGSHLFPLHLSL